MIFLFLGHQSVYAETITVDVDVKSFYTKGRNAYVTCSPKTDPVVMLVFSYIIG